MSGGRGIGRVDPEERDFHNLPFVADDGTPWQPPALSGDSATVHSAEWALGALYAAAFLAHARSFAASDPAAAGERLVEIIAHAFGAMPSNVVRGFVAGLGSAIAHGAVDIPLAGADVIARPGWFGQSLKP